MVLTQDQIVQAATLFATEQFVMANLTANLGTTEIQAAFTALDNAMNATLNQAVAVQGGATLVKVALLNQIRTAVPSVTVQQAALILIYWAKKAAGL